MTTRARIEEQASGWVIRQDSGDWPADVQAEFERWISESLSHRIVYLRLRSVWQRADGLRDQIPAHRLSQLQPAAQWPPPSVPRRHGWRIAAGAAIGAAVLGVALRWHGAPLGSDYRTAIGARQALVLA